MLLILISFIFAIKDDGIAIVGNGDLTESQLQRLSYFNTVLRFNHAQNLRRNDKITHLMVGGNPHFNQILQEEFSAPGAPVKILFDSQYTCCRFSIPRAHPNLRFSAPNRIKFQAIDMENVWHEIFKKHFEDSALESKLMELYEKTRENSNTLVLKSIFGIEDKKCTVGMKGILLFLSHENVNPHHIELFGFNWNNLDTNTPHFWNLEREIAYLLNFKKINPTANDGYHGISHSP